MTNPIKSYHPDQPNINELRLISRGLAFLAILTGLLYLRVLVSGQLFTAETAVLQWLSVGFVLIGTAGLLATLKWESLGGLTAVLAGLVLAGLIYMATEQDWLTTFFYSSPFVISGLLALVCWQRDRRH